MLGTGDRPPYTRAAMVVQAAPMQGPERLGDFSIRSLLGRGGNGTVYAASSARHPEVALKVLRADLALSERERHHFFEEIERMRRVWHPSLVALVAAGTLPDGRPYLCMPLLRGETVAACVEKGRLSVEIGLGYFGGLAEGVAALHRAGLVHRDIKPENVLLDAAARRAVLLDFGIAREIDGATTTTTLAGGLRGTPAYMAPERFFGTPANVATDIYELAVVLYVMLVGRRPWDADTADARLHPRTPKDFGVEVPSALVTTLMKALSTRPEARPASADAFADEARRALHLAADVQLSPSEPAVAAQPAASGRTFVPTPGAMVAARYRLDRRLGVGGMGEVWAATHMVTQKTVALKFLRSDLARNDRYRRRFVREARAASQVRHPNVVQIHDVIELDCGAPMMVMDLLEGESLRDRLVREQMLPVAETARLLLPVVSAVSTAHDRGVIHRDLKPDNIFVANAAGAARVVVLDFGIAKLTVLDGGSATTGTLTADGSMLGTPYYMSPEQIYGEADVDHRTDIWSLGIILYECLTGRRPTQADGVGQILKIITHHEIVAIDRLLPGLPTHLSSLIMSMLAAKREERPSSLASLYRELEAVSRHVDSGALGVLVAPPSPREGAGRRIPTRVWGIGATIIAALALAVGARARLGPRSEVPASPRWPALEAIATTTGTATMPRVSEPATSAAAPPTAASAVIPRKAPVSGPAVKAVQRRPAPAASVPSASAASLSPKPPSDPFDRQ
jgi:serine/threonine protein kinase